MGVLAHFYSGRDVDQVVGDGHIFSIVDVQRPGKVPQ
jgi:hypothetical protein